MTMPYPFPVNIKNQYLAQAHFITIMYFIQLKERMIVLLHAMETVIQTDPNTCLMVLSGGVPPPSIFCLWLGTASTFVLGLLLHIQQ